MNNDFPFTRQHDSMQCGIACLQMVCKYFGREYTIDSLSKLCFATAEGVSMLGINEAANVLGLHTVCVKTAIGTLSDAILDEATNSLDANNERSIVENLDKFYNGKTVVIVAHRLSTVKNADQIVVIDHGRVVEVGNHESLTAKRGAYYNLVKNQLELGN